MSNTKKRVFPVVVIAAVALAAAACAYWFLFRKSDGDGVPVPVARVSVIAGLSGGLQNRYAGVVEAQATLEVKLDQARALGECFVSVGDEVTQGQALFSYDTGQQALDLEQRDLDIERAEKSMLATESAVEELKKLRDKATTDASRLEYSLQIQSYELQLKQDEYTLKLKRLERDKLAESLDNAVVYAEMTGVIQSITDPSAQGDMGYYPQDGAGGAYIVILAEGEYRVKGQINEQNIAGLSMGGEVTIRSRLDSGATWAGVIDFIDFENPVSGGDNPYAYYGPSSDLMTSSSKYPFYVQLESSEGLLLGQHVFIEPANADRPDGETLWLPEYYVITENGKSFVWAADQGRDRLEKREVQTGAVDEAAFKLEIVSGLSPDDEIAWPAGDLKEGRTVIREGFANPGYPAYGGESLPGEAEIMPGETGLLPGGDGPPLEDGVFDDVSGGEAPAPAAAPSQAPALPPPDPVPASGTSLR